MKNEKITIENYNATKEEDIVTFCVDQKVDLVIVGPEVPLSNGLAGKHLNIIYGIEETIKNLFRQARYG